MDVDIDSDYLEEILSLKEEPSIFIEKILGLHLWEKQAEIAEAVRDNQITAVRSCHGAGKTAIAANIALWYLFTRPYSTVITTAPTGRQVTELLWKEIRKAYKNARGPLGGYLLPKAAKLSVDDDWILIGFSTDDDVNFQGWHSRGGTLVIFDEAPGVDHKIWDAVKGVLVGRDDRLLAIGNPTESSGPFYNLFRDNVGCCIHISAHDIPNVKERRTVIPGLSTHEWVEDRQSEWGESSPLFQARVLGNFPDSDDRTLVPLSWIDAACERWKRYTASGAWPTTGGQLGVDVARHGSDKTVIIDAIPTLGIREIFRFPRQSTMETVGSVIETIKKTGAQAARIDSDGIGAGVFDRLIEVVDDKTARIVEMRGGMKSSDPTRYLNSRAEWFWTLRERLNPEAEIPLAIPDDDNLRGQLSGMRWSLSSKGQIKIESKDDMRARGMKSPDEADAAAYALAVIEEEFDVVDHLAAMIRM